jgi:predicted ATPase
LVGQASRQARYRFLESVWQFALEMLEAHDERVALRERHLTVYLELGEQAEKIMAGSGVAQQIAELRRRSLHLQHRKAVCIEAELDSGGRGRVSVSVLTW